MRRVSRHFQPCHVEERNSFLTPLKEDPPFESLHSDPRWKALLRRVNFPIE
jgi:hypothetical protein